MADNLIKEGNNSLFLAQRLGQMKQTEQNVPTSYKKKEVIFFSSLREKKGERRAYKYDPKRNQTILSCVSDFSSYYCCPRNCTGYFA